MESVTTSFSELKFQVKTDAEKCRCIVRANWVHCSCTVYKIFWIQNNTRLTALCLGLPGWAGTKKVKPIWIYWRDSEWQWHQLGHMQICTLPQTDNHASTPPLSFYRLDALPATQPAASNKMQFIYIMFFNLHDLPNDNTTYTHTFNGLFFQVEQGLTSHQTHYRSYQGRVFTGQMTQPTVSKH